MHVIGQGREGIVALGLEEQVVVGDIGLQHIGKITAEHPSDQVLLAFKMIVERFAVLPGCCDDVGNRDLLYRLMLCQLDERVPQKPHSV